MLCEYGCEKQAKYQFKNGRWCCSKNTSKCSIIRKKLTDGYKNGTRKVCCKKYPDPRQSTISLIQNLQKKYSLMKFEDLPISEKRRRIFKDQNNKCAICGIEEWCNKPINLHLDHIDGNRNNRLRENLRLICPNCDSQTSTYCRGNNKPMNEDKLKEFLLETDGNISESLTRLGVVSGATNWRKAKMIFETMGG